MTTYTTFKESGIKGVQSLDSVFVVEATINATEQNFVQNDLVTLFELPANTLVLRTHILGTTATDEGAAANIEIGHAADTDSILAETDVRTVNYTASLAPASTAYFADATTINVKTTSSLTYNDIILKIRLVCCTI